MARDVVNALVTDEGEYGFSLTSPQIPELVFGRATEAEFMREYQDALRKAGFRAGQVLGHFQVRRQTPEGAEAIVRYQTDDGKDDRLVVANAVIRLLTAEEESRELLDGLHPSATGEYIFVACLASDRLGWLVDQLRPNGDAIIASLMVADVMVAMTQVASDAALDWPTIDDLGWNREMTIGDLLARNTSDRPLLLRA